MPPEWVTEFLAPITLGVLAGAVAIATAVIARRSKKEEVHDGREPSVDASWTRAELAIAESERHRERAVFWREAFEDLQRLMHRFFWRLEFHHPEVVVTEEERRAVEETPALPPHLLP